MKTKLILVLIEGFTLLLLLWMIAPFTINIGKVPNQLLMQAGVSSEPCWNISVIGMGNS